MKFKADEIASVLQQEIEHYESQIDVREVGRVLEVGDGIARVYGLSRRHGRRNGRVPQRRHRPGLQPGRELGRRDHPRRLSCKSHEGDEVKSTGRLLSVPVGDARDRPRGRSAGQSARRQGPDRHQRAPAVEFMAPGVSQRQAGPRAAANRHQGHRRDDAHRPRPARADHRRPQDRQDGHRHRRDHQPEGLAA